MMDFIKKVGRISFAGYGFLYDWLRFIKFNGWKKDIGKPLFRAYYSTKVAHTLEKSMSYKEQKACSGFDNAKLLLEILKGHNENGTFSDRLAAKILQEFCVEKGQKFNELLNSMPGFQDIDSAVGSMKLLNSDFESMKLNNPELFFLGRSSLREYSGDEVDIDIVKRALVLAQKSPSSCNMQPCHVYLIKNPKLLLKAMNIQSGNRGFGHKINGLLLVTVDQTAFISSSERYQHWIDGGMYAMSIVYALHSLGVGSCCLNWSEDPRRDLRLRSDLGIRGEHSIVMFISYGWPEEENKVCVSPRRKFNETYTII